MKNLLHQAWPQLLMKRIKADDYKALPAGCVHLMSVSPTEGLVWSTLSKNEVVKEINFIRVESIDSFDYISLFKVCALCVNSSITS